MTTEPGTYRVLVRGDRTPEVHDALAKANIASDPPNEIATAGGVPQHLFHAYAEGPSLADATATVRAALDGLPVVVPDPDDDPGGA